MTESSLEVLDRLYNHCFLAKMVLIPTLAPFECLLIINVNLFVNDCPGRFMLSSKAVQTRRVRTCTILSKGDYKLQNDVSLKFLLLLVLVIKGSILN